MKWVIPVLMVLLAVAVTAAPEGNRTEDNDAEEKVETFQEMEKNFKTGVGNIVKKILPYLLQGGSDAQISGPCTSSIMRIIGGVRQLKEWAMRFLDATGKIPPGILEGTSLSVGDFDECLDIEVGKKDLPPKSPEDVLFRGQYCMLENHRPASLQKAIDDFQNGNKEAPIAKTKTFLNMMVRYKHLTNSTFKIGVCIPSKCTKEDINNILNSESLRAVGKITVSYCETKGEKEKTLDQLFLLCILGFFGSCIVLGTAVDMYFRCQKRKKDQKKSEALTYTGKIVNSTSLYSNAINVLNTNNFHEPIACLCGIRTIAVILTIYSHTYGHIHLLHFQKFSKAANFIRFFENFFFAGIANGSVGVDTIVFLAAVTLTYNGWKNSSENGKVDPPIFKMLISRYFRLTTAQLLTICLFLLFPLFGSGPLWQAYMNDPLGMCREKWWLNTLYVNNFFKTTEICLYHTWALSLIMQLTVLGVIVMWILKKSQWFGIFLMIAIILAGIIGVGVMTVIHELPGSLAFFMLDIKTFPIAWRDVYTLPYDHMGPFCIGLLTGYYLARNNNKLEIGKLTSAALWCCCLAGNTAVMFGLYDYRHGQKMSVALSTFYAVMHRNVWAIGISWIVIACSTHHGGPVTRVLKSKFFVPLDRLCYMAYMLHIPIMFYHSGSLRERWYMGHLELLFLGIAYIVISFAVSFLVYITFVAPYYALEEHVGTIFRRKNKVNFEPKTVSSIPNGSIVSLEDNTGVKSNINTMQPHK